MASGKGLMSMRQSSIQREELCEIFRADECEENGKGEGLAGGASPYRADSGGSRLPGLNSSDDTVSSLVQNLRTILDKMQHLSSASGSDIAGSAIETASSSAFAGSDEVQDVNTL